MASPFTALVGWPAKYFPMSVARSILVRPVLPAAFRSFCKASKSRSLVRGSSRLSKVCGLFFARCALVVPAGFSTPPPNSSHILPCSSPQFASWSMNSSGPTVIRPSTLTNPSLYLSGCCVSAQAVVSKGRSWAAAVGADKQATTTASSRYVTLAAAVGRGFIYSHLIPAALVGFRIRRHDVRFRVRDRRKACKPSAGGFPQLHRSWAWRYDEIVVRTAYGGPANTFLRPTHPVIYDRKNVASEVAGQSNGNL